jgi:(2Fe-2S) ferredoxin
LRGRGPLLRYARPRIMQKRARYVWVCTKARPEGHKKGSCGAKGGEALCKAIKIAAGKAGIDARVCASGCFDLCWVGASVGVMPDMAFFKHMTAEDIPHLLEALRQSGNVAEFAPLADKLVQPEDFVDPNVAGSGD